MNIKEYLLNMPSGISKEAIADHETRFHFLIEGEDGGEFTLAIENGEVTAVEGLLGEPKCVVKAKSENLSSILEGNLNPMTAVFTGKLKISNPGEMMKYAKIFGLM